jgi:hypothetical protein
MINVYLGSHFNNIFREQEDTTSNFTSNADCILGVLQCVRICKKFLKQRSQDDDNDDDDDDDNDVEDIMTTTITMMAASTTTSGEHNQETRKRLEINQVVKLPVTPAVTRS